MIEAFWDAFPFNYSSTSRLNRGLLRHGTNAEVYTREKLARFVLFTSSMNLVSVTELSDWLFFHTCGHISIEVLFTQPIEEQMLS